MSNSNQRQPIFSHDRDTWRTPADLYRQLSSEFGQFDHDPCPPNHTVDGLFSEWGERNFVNPPYGNGIHRWLAKGLHEAHHGKLSVFLIPSRTDTTWWHDLVMQADEVRFLRGRLHFDDSKHSAPFPSAVVIFRPRGSDGHAPAGVVSPGPGGSPPALSAVVRDRMLIGRFATADVEPGWQDGRLAPRSQVLQRRPVRREDVIDFWDMNR